jgi:hypothetical protein
MSSSCAPSSTLLARFRGLLLRGVQVVDEPLDMARLVVDGLLARGELRRPVGQLLLRDA